MHTALLCLVLLSFIIVFDGLIGFFYQYSLGLLQWYCGNPMILQSKWSNREGYGQNRLLSNHKETPSPWRHNEHNGVWNHRYFDSLFNCLLRLTSNESCKSAPLVLCERNQAVTNGFHSQRACNTDSGSIQRHHYAICVNHECVCWEALYLYSDITWT